MAGRYSRNITLEDNTVYDNRGANIYLINTINVLVRRNFVFCTNDPISWRGTGSIYRPGPGLQVRDEDFKKPSPPVSTCLLYTSPSPRDGLLSRMPSSA